MNQKLLIVFNDQEIALPDVMALLVDSNKIDYLLCATEARPVTIKEGNYFIYGTQTRSQRKIEIRGNNVAFSDKRAKVSATGEESDCDHGC